MTKNSLLRPCTLIWLTLVVLTGITFAVGEFGLGGPLVVGGVLTVSLIKGQMVADHFMGLKHAPRGWRVLLFGYLCFVCGMIGLAYHIGITA